MLNRCVTKAHINQPTYIWIEERELYLKVSSQKYVVVILLNFMRLWASVRTGCVNVWESEWICFGLFVIASRCRKRITFIPALVWKGNYWLEMWSKLVSVEASWWFYEAFDLLSNITVHVKDKGVSDCSFHL